MTEYLPEGCLIGTADNRSSLLSYYTLSECMTSGKILEAPCIICDSHHNLILDLGCMKGFIPREEGALGITEGTTKDIALISRVNKPVAFVITVSARTKTARPTRCFPAGLRRSAACAITSAR